MEKATGDMRRLQLEELEILSFFDKTCVQQGLTYYLAYGSLLGAVRHKGFIPWDDDDRISNSSSCSLRMSPVAFSIMLFPPYGRILLVYGKAA